MNREQEWYYVSLCEQTKRYEEMFEKVLCLLQQCSQVEEHQVRLLSISYKNMLSPIHALLRVYKASKALEQYQKFLQIFQEQEIKIEKELFCIYELFLNLLEQIIANNDSQIIFECLSLKRTTLKYLIELEKNEEKKNYYSDQYNTDCFKMNDIAKNFPPIDPSRLRMALEMSTIYQKAGLIERSYHTAKNAFDTALNALEKLTADEFAKNSNEISLILNLLKDNMVLCSAPMINE